MTCGLHLDKTPDTPPDHVRSTTNEQHFFFLALSVLWLRQSDKGIGQYQSHSHFLEGDSTVDKWSRRRSASPKVPFMCDLCEMMINDVSLLLVILKKNSCDSGRLTFPNEMNGNSELNFYCTLKLEPRLSSSSSSSVQAALYHIVSNFIILGWVEFWGPANAMMVMVNGGEESQFIKRLATKSKFIVGH